MSVKRILLIAATAVSIFSLSTAAMSQPPAGGRGGAGAAAGAAGRGAGRGPAAPAIDVSTLPKQTVTVAQGQAQGYVQDGVAKYFGLPFAAPPVGDLRWKRPQPAANWSGVRDATKAGNQCGNNEDCLYLNVYKPDGAKAGDKLPVLFWIHGGSFTGGTGSSPQYDGTKFVKQGMVVVTINYRLGRAGWFSHPALTKEGQPSNFGLLDQIAALQWAKANVARFGGDPGKVTIFGESAGAISVLYLTIVPEARGLFVRAISESGFPRSVPATRANAEAYAVRAATAAGVTGDSAASAAALRRLPLSAFPASTGYFDNTRAYPTIDGVSIKYNITDGYARGDNRVPLMIGGNSRDASLYNMQNSLPAALNDVPNRARMVPLFNPGGRLSDGQLINDYWTALRMTEPDRNIARIVAAQKKPVWLYYFSYEQPDARNAAIRGAAHGAEIGYVFGSTAGLAGENLATSQSMTAYWAAFAKYGDPGAAGGPQWDRYNAANDNLLEFSNTGPKVTTKLLDAQLNFVEQQPHT